MFDFIVVGAGFAGCVVAERIASQLNKKVLVIEKRAHIGGNCYDYRDEYGILIHKYGPHIFHTSYDDVFNYLSNFTNWIPYQHRVLGYIDGKKVPIPFNFESIQKLFPEDYSANLQAKLIKYFGYDIRVPILEMKSIDDKDVQFLADYIYKKVFLNYTIKQWGVKPEDIDPQVTGRVPVVIGRDDRYFDDKYQYLPENGYTFIFENMLSNDNIKILLNTDFKELVNVDIENKKISFMGNEFKGMLIFTGMIDELFDYKFGVLPYRSLEFRLKTVETEFFQEVATVNYPNDYDFTRITEYKHFYKPFYADNVLKKTKVMYEFPVKYDTGKIPYYPVLSSKAKEIYSKYRELSLSFKNLKLVGRLAEFRYYDMDDIVKRSLEVFEELGS